MDEQEIPNEVFGLKIGVEEIQRNLATQDQSVNAIKAFARTIFGAASLIASLIGVLGLMDTKVTSSYQNLYNNILIAAAILYIILIILCLIVLSPMKMYIPIKSDWQVIYESFMGDETTVLRNRLIAYISTYKDNEKFITSKNRIIIIAGIILGVIVLLLLGVCLIPRTL